MGHRPAHIDLNRDDDDELPQPRRPNLYMDLPSPRIGEAPPALSPLDAIAMHSRLLARRFEESAESGRRISRIRHSDVAKEMAQRPDFFRSLSRAGDGESDGEMDELPELQEDSPNSQKGGLVRNGEGSERPMSHYPVFGNAGRDQRNDRPLSTPFETPNEYFDAPAELASTPNAAPQDYFGIAAPRAASPEPVDKRMINIQAASPMTMPSLTNSVESVQSMQAPPPRTLTNGSTRSQRSLKPPKSPAYPRSPRSFQSVRSVPPDSGDEDTSVSGSHAASVSRKVSGSSTMSRPQSPYSPWMHPMPRSPSSMSDYSTNGSQKCNFSRPLTSGGSRADVETRPSFDSRSSFETRPSTDLPHRQRSAASGGTHYSSAPPSRQMSADDVETPFATPMPWLGAQGDSSSESRPSTSYTYTKFTLPRGRNVERNSRGTRESWMQKQFTWDQEAPVELDAVETVSIVGRERSNSDGGVLEPPPRRPESPAVARSLERRERTKRERARPRTSGDRSRSIPRTFEKANAIHKSTPSVKTDNTDSTERTIKATPLHERSPSAELTPEEHLELGIQTHSDGQLNKSTYHLRLAAKAGLPTAMLLYALACRHGWGMRPNQEEGVMWLRKAIDSAGLEVADVEATLTSSNKMLDPVSEAQERRKRKAQFALAIYELGISYMNGWGCPRDKPLAVSCFEVAGSWGDCDALAEAGFCYTQGNGCKKDLKKAAAFYRRAAEGGMSMAGNSWIYKPKYMDEVPKSPALEKDRDKERVETSLSSISKDANREKEKEVKGGRSRGRSIWSRKKVA